MLLLNELELVVRVECHNTYIHTARTWSQVMRDLSIVVYELCSKRASIFLEHADASHCHVILTRTALIHSRVGGML